MLLCVNWGDERWLAGTVKVTDPRAFAQDRTHFSFSIEHLQLACFLT